jgi:hypothetical protein
VLRHQRNCDRHGDGRQNGLQRDDLRQQGRVAAGGSIAANLIYAGLVVLAMLLASVVLGCLGIEMDDVKSLEVTGRRPQT